MAKKIGIVVDSPADFPDGMVQKLGLHILPVHIFVGGKDHLHGIDISNSEVVDNLKQKIDVHTTPYFPGECAEFFEKIIDQYDQILSFHVSNELSGDFKSATSAMNLLFEDEAEKIKLIDTRNVTVGQALLVKKTIELIRNNRSTFNIENVLERYISRSLLYFTVDNLFWLKRAGRVSALGAFFGSVMDIKPVISLQEGKLIPIEKHRGRKSVIKSLLTICKKSQDKFPDGFEVWIGHSDAMDDALFLRKKIGEITGKSEKKIPVVEVGPTIAAHTGPGSLCFAMTPN